MKLSKDFSIHEFVPAAIYEHYVDKSIWFIDPKIVQKQIAPIILKFSGLPYRQLSKAAPCRTSIGCGGKSEFFDSLYANGMHNKKPPTWKILVSG